MNQLEIKRILEDNSNKIYFKRGKRNNDELKRRND